MSKAMDTVEVPVEMVEGVAAIVKLLSSRTSLAPEERDLLQDERDLQDCLNAIGRAGMKTLLVAADTKGPEVIIDGARWGKWGRTRGEYTTLFGAVSLERSTYQLHGRGSVAVPLDLRLGIMEGRYTPSVARIMAHAVGLMPEADAERFLAETGVAVVSVSTLHRVPRKIAARYETRREIIDCALRQEFHVPEPAVTVQVSLDGVMVPQDGEHTQPRGRAPKDGVSEPPRYEVHYGPMGKDSPCETDGESGRPWHEASVGALHFVDELAQPLATICLARMPEVRKTTLLSQLEAEVVSVLEQRPDLDVVLASDGAPLHWKALGEMLERIGAQFGVRVFAALDFYHAAQYLTKAANIIWDTDIADASIHAATWRETLKARADGAENVLGSLRYYRDRLSTKAKRESLQDVIDFLAGHHSAGRMDYYAMQMEGLPIGTGVIEATAKTIVNTRMKRAGARFSQHGGQAILLFRAALVSDRFDPLMRNLHGTYRKVVSEPQRFAA